MFPWNKRLRGLRRYQNIAQALVKYGYIDVAEALRLRRPLRLGQRLFGVSEIISYGKPQRLRMLFEELGPTFVKFGQLLSTRVDALPPEYLSELAALHDQVAVEPFSVMQAIVEAELQAPLGHLFATVEAVPLAAASIAQVHRATLPNGAQVVIKVQRPRIPQTIAADLDVLRDLAHLAERYVVEWRPFQPIGLVEEFAQTITKELDFRQERRNLERCAHHFADDPTVLIPNAYAELSTSRVLTLAYVAGTKISDRAALLRAGHDPHVVAVHGATALLKQIFVHGFFQGDPHPGNLLVLPNDVIAILDYGMFGTIDAETREQLAALLLGVVQRNAAKMIRALTDLDIVVSEPHRRRLQRDVSTLVDTYLSVPLAQIDLTVMLDEMFKIIHGHDLQIPPEFLLLLRALTTAEGLGRQLDPAFSIAEHIQPFAEQLVLERYDPRYIMRRLGTMGEDTGELLSYMPGAMMHILERVQRGELKMGVEMRQLDRLTRDFDTASNRLTLAIILAASIIGSSLVIQTETPPLLWGYPALGLIGFLISVVLGLSLVIAILRSGGF
jgi:ubiquinone biosynthesis protein